MKRMIIVSALTLTSLPLSFGQGAQKKIKTDKIPVSGICNECKERIENAAYLPGVKRADWDKQAQELTVTYRPQKVALYQIEENIAHAGHDAGAIKASDSAYLQLPHCCAYHEKETH